MSPPNYNKVHSQTKNHLFSQIKNFWFITTYLFSMHAIATTTSNQAIFDKSAPLLSKQIKWNGIYLGANMGGAWGANHANLIVPSDPATRQYWGPEISAGAVPTLINYSQSGPIGGGQLGFNYKYSNKVLVGIEADINGANIQGAKSEYFVNGQQIGGATYTPWYGSAGSRLTWLGTVRARMGYLPIQPIFLYATGGFAYAGTKNNYYNAAPKIPSLYTSSQTNTLTGYTAGGGLELMFQARWSIKAEYLYYNLGNATNPSTPGGVDAALVASGQIQTVSNRFSTAGNIIHVGLNYHFS